MRDITQKMESGKIMIGNTAVQVQDASGNFRDLTDILGDVESATDGMGDAQRSAAIMSTFTADSMKGINKIMSVGTDQVKDYRASLEDCTGTAEEMAGVMNDNLGGDLKALGSAAEGLGLKLFEYFEGPLRGAAQIATDVLNGITDFLTPQRTELETFIDDIIQGNVEARKTIDNINAMTDNATAQIGELEAYKEVLSDLTGRTNLNAYEQYQLKNAVDALSGSIPELAAAFDEETGVLNLTNQELVDMFNNAEALAMQNAIWEAKKSAMEEYAKAAVRVYEAESAVKAAQEERADALEYAKQVNASYTDETNRTAAQVAIATSAYNEAIRTRDELKQKVDEEEKALEGVAEEWGLTNQQLDEYRASTEEAATATEVATESTEQLADAVKITDDDFKSLAKSTGLSVEELQAIAEASDLSVEELTEVAEYVAKTRKEFEDLRDSVEKSMADSLGSFQAFSGGAVMEADEILANLQGTNAAITQWADNMATLGAMAGDGMSQGLYDELLEMGPGAANIVQKLIDTLNNDAGKFKEISDQYAANLDLTKRADGLAQFSTAGKAVSENTAKGVKDGAVQIETAAKESTRQATDAMNNEINAGLDVVNNSMSAQFGSIRSTVQTATNEAYNSVLAMVNNMRSALSTTLQGPNIKVPHFKMTGAFDAKTNKVPTVSVDWYAKGAIFTKPTVFDTPYGFKGVGEAGAEAVLPIDLLKNYISDAIDAAPASVINVEMTVNGAESPEMWAADFAKTLKQQLRIG